jgi:putative DNA primase/helicase
MPVVLEEDDRRHAVIWTPVQLSPEYYKAVLDELDNGGVAALHDYLLTVDLGEFGAGSKPPMTAAKLELIGLSLDSTARFYYALNNGDIPGLIARPSLSEDVYEAYTIWCKRTGNRAAPQQKLINALQRHHKVLNRRERYRMGSNTKGPHGTLMLGDCDMPPGADRINWLGDHISEFRGAVADYKEATKS